jgi:hypothetical protein
VAALVREGKFEEAEHLVHEFNLEPELVLCKKTVALNELVCAGKEDMLEALLQCLRQMKDKDAAASLILDSQYPSLTIAQSVLSTLCLELAGVDCSFARSSLSALDKLTTFQLICVEGRFREDWPSFHKDTCLQLVAYLLQADRLSHARLFWTRHQLAVEEELSQADLDSLLQLIPSDLSSLPSWLSGTIFPFFLAHCPHQMTLFLSQLTTVLCCLGQNDPDNWPRNVLSVIGQLLLSVSQLHPSHGSPPDISPLTQLQRKLQKLASMPPIMRRNLSFARYDQVLCSATALIPVLALSAVHPTPTGLSGLGPGGVHRRHEAAHCWSSR